MLSQAHLIVEAWLFASIALFVYCVLCVVLFMRCWNFECPAPPDVCVCTSYGRRVVLLLARVSPHRTVQRVLRAELGGGPGPRSNSSSGWGGTHISLRGTRLLRNGIELQYSSTST